MPMNTDLNATKIILVLLVEFVFGLGYNALVAWAHEKKLLHVSMSVVIGVAVTLLIAAASWMKDQMPFLEACALLTACFTASGIPMIVGSMRRTVVVKDNKKRRPLPNSAMKVRDDAVMEISALAHEIAERSKKKELNASDLPDYVNRLHGVIGMLKSV
jgi:hypothetical protein